METNYGYKLIRIFIVSFTFLPSCPPFHHPIVECMHIFVVCLVLTLLWRLGCNRMDDNSAFSLGESKHCQKTSKKKKKLFYFLFSHLWAQCSQNRINLNKQIIQIFLQFNLLAFQKFQNEGNFVLLCFLVCLDLDISVEEFNFFISFHWMLCHKWNKDIFFNSKYQYFVVAEMPSYISLHS